MPPASYLTKAALAAELMISETSVDDYVRRGLLPSPVRISSGCVRWRWETVDEVLKASQGHMRVPNELSDEEGVRRVIEASRQRSKPMSLDARKVAQQAGLASIAEMRASVRGPKDAAPKRFKRRPPS
jgi:predicted DNA-binding transcriptional regulator AlpA